MSLFYRLITQSLRGYFQLFYRYSVYGATQPYQGRALLAANHASFLDPPFIGAAYPEVLHFLARSTLFHYKIAEVLLTHLNAHPIQGTVQDIESFRLICRLLSEEKKVVIFPEGERSATGHLQAMKSGLAMLALRMQCPIIPVYISGTFETWPRHKRWPKMGTPIACVFGKPIFPISSLDLTKKQKQEIMTQQVKDSLEQLRQWLEAGAQGQIP